jgi:GAF domain-containing protein
VRTLVRQLHAAERGDPPEPVIPFERHLLDELDSVTTAQQAAEMLADRLRHLQELTTELADATDVGDIAEVFVTHATQAFGATFAAVYELAGDRLNALCSTGMSEDRMVGWRSIPLAADLPACVAVRTGEVESVPYGPELIRRYPTLTHAVIEHRSIMCAPMKVRDRTLGVIALTLDEHRDVTDPQEVAFLASLADACAQALDRARALASERRTTDKLEVLASASAELVSTMDHRSTFGHIADLLVPRFADWVVIRTVTDGAFDEMSVAHVDPRGRFYAQALGRYHEDPDEGTGSAVVVRTGTPLFIPVVTEEMLAAGSNDEEHLNLLHKVGVGSLIIVPLLAEGKAFGFLSMGYGVSGRHYAEEDLTFAEDLAHRAALAVQQARRYQQQTGRLAAITRIAEAAQHAILTDVPDRVGAVQLAGSYVSAAREALIGGDMYEVVPISGGVRLLVGDVRGKGLDAVRLATVVLGFFRSAAAEPISLAGLAWQMDRRLTPYLDEEDFVTAVMVEIDTAGHCQVVSCGHPFPLLCDAKGMREIECPISLPLGLDAQPRTVHLDLSPGDRLFLYTDGLVEARNPDGEYVDLMEVAAPLRNGDLRAGLDDVLVRLRQNSRQELDDDLSLLVAEYLPVPGP